ncbi:hypothetical protein A3D00_03445 [Candidatus Woesebacteria bacterium RIFCSPHIGHO2_02_FULL_38_9]|nr:MAG: hypothetical protein A3D00_03445 [Candidatus Woesebacteria bacterium RIFCSPHIGHO2_02_FULL_38_9]
MLNRKEYLKKFKYIQEIIIEVTDDLVRWVTPGISEKEIADKYSSMLSGVGLRQHWYPILVCVGDITGQPISRRIHLPSQEIKVRRNDVVFVDCTPIDGTVWGNWCKTFIVGNNHFFEELTSDCRFIVDETYKFSSEKAKTVGDLYNFCLKIIHNKQLEILDPYKDVGHSIFQVKVGQSVENTPMSERLFLNDRFREIKLSGIISIEPQVGRKNKVDRKMYGAKLQKIIIY